MALYGEFHVSISLDCLRSSSEFLFALAAGGFGDFAVLLGMDHQHRALEFGADFFEVGADVIAVARVVHHDEQNGLFAQLFVLGIAVAAIPRCRAADNRRISR